jgi:malonate-semialdehyde dehydrogenase (acetylating)/methylmalonate-semialdehyde dehydrogenase
MKTVPLYIGGEFVESQTEQWIDVTDPATNEVIARAPCTTDAEMRRAIDHASEVFKSWKETPVSERARVMMRYQGLLKEHHDEIAEILSQETGKTFEDAKGDVWRGIEVVEHAANIPSMMMGETVENVAREIDTYSYIQPLGVCAGITPFNFPAMIPLWMFPMAIACGNTFILKPSEQDPLTPTRLAELFEQAGAPKGVLQVVHGGKEQVDILLTDPAIKAVSFVGSVPVGRYIYETGTKNMKRVQSLQAPRITWLSCRMPTSTRSSMPWWVPLSALPVNAAWRFRLRSLWVKPRNGFPMLKRRWQPPNPAHGMTRAPALGR